MLKRHLRKDPLSLLIYVGLVLLAFLWLAPIVWVVGLSFKPNEVLMTRTDGILAPPFTLKNYRDIIGSSSVFGWMLIYPAGKEKYVLWVSNAVAG